MAVLTPGPTVDGSEPAGGEGMSDVAAVARELAGIVVARRRGREQEEDDDGPARAGVVFARDLAALAELQARHPLPAAYAEFLRAHSSHDFVASGLVCAGEAAWIAPVDTVGELTRCCEGAAPLRLVCAVSERGYYVLDLARERGGDCPVLHVDDRGAAREVAGGFVGFLRRVARESRSGHVKKDMSVKTGEIADERGRALGWLAALAVAVFLLLAYAVAALAG